MKRFASIFLVSIILITSLFVVSANALTPKEKFKAYKESQGDYSKIDVFKSIWGNLYLERMDFEVSDCAMYYYTMGKYKYTAVGGAYNLYVYDYKKNKEYSIYNAYKKGVINKSKLPRISRLIADVYGVTMDPFEISINAGEKVFLNKYIGSWKIEDKKIAKTSKTNGTNYILGLSKGTTEVCGKYNGEELSCDIIVKNNPKLTKNNKTIKAVTIKKGRTVKIRIKGKVKSIKNVYKNTKYAKIVSKKSASVIKVKGLKKGVTNLKVKVNGVKQLNLKVTVK